MKKQTKFKERDRIRLVGEKDSSWGPEAEPGMEGIVINPEPMKGYPSVAIDLDGVPRNHGFFGEGWFFRPKNLELVTDG